MALIIGPWNYPLQLLLSPLVGAIAAGNCAVLKPSEFAPHTAAVIAELIRATFPEEYIAVVQGERETAEALLREKFDTIFFTGSTARRPRGDGGRRPASDARHARTRRQMPVPRLRRRAAGDHRPAHRLGQIHERRPDLRRAGLRAGGPPRSRDRLVEALKRALREFYGDDPQQSPDYGRIINRQALRPARPAISATAKSSTAASTMPTTSTSRRPF